MFLFQLVRVGEKIPGATRVVFGVLTPSERDFDVPCPSLTGSLTSPDGAVSVTPRNRQSLGLNFASPRVIRWVWSQLERHPVDVAEHDAAALERRRVALREFIAGGTQARSAPDGELGLVTAEDGALPLGRPEQTPFVIGHIGHYACGALGLPAEEAVGLVMDRVPALAREDVERWILSALEGGSFYVFDSEGRRLDARAAEIEARRRAETSKAERVEADLASPNTQTLAELEWLAIRVRKDVHVPTSLRAMRKHLGGLLILPRTLAVFARLVPGELSTGVALLPETFVPDGSVRDIASTDEKVQADAYVTSQTTGERTFSPGALAIVMMLLARGERVITQGETYDESSADGQYRVEILESLSVPEFFPEAERLSPLNMAGPAFGLGLRILFDAGIHGLSLADDVAASALHRLVREKWERTALKLKPADFDFLEREKSRSREQTPPYVAKTWAPPALPPRFASEESLLDAYRASSQGQAPLFEKDALYTNPDATVFDRIRTAIGAGDPWAPLVRDFVLGKELVRSEDIAAALAEAGETARGQRDQRVYKIMRGLGWTKTEKPVDGRRVKVWLRTEVSPWTSARA